MIAVGSFGVGRNAYVSSAGFTDGIMAQMHFFSIDDLKKAAMGQIDKSAITPYSMLSLKETYAGKGRIMAAYDSTSKTIYVLRFKLNPPGTDSSADWSRLFVYKIE